MLCMSVRCPSCRTVLTVPDGHRGNKFLCGQCRTKFKVPSLSDSQIVDLIGLRNLDETSAGNVPALDNSLLAEDILLGGDESVGKNGNGNGNGGLAFQMQSAFSTGIDGFSIARIDSQGALFELRPEVYRRPEFRAAMPRRCLRCGVTHHLKPHLVIFSHLMRESSVLETELVITKPDITEEQILQLDGPGMLKRMPEIRRLPKPANLPMPYWICDMCSPANMVFAQGKLTGDGSGIMRMQIHRIWRALDFLKNLGCVGSEAWTRLEIECGEKPETPWDTLSGVVQQRVHQWYKPAKGEEFAAYAPDRSKNRSEDGMSGLIVTTRRLIYNCSLRYKEVGKGRPMELNFIMEEGRLKLDIKTPDWEVKNLLVDKAGLERLRRAMTIEKFNATWR